MKSSSYELFFSNQTGAKIRPAVVVSGPHPSRDFFFVPLTSKTAGLLPGEFMLADWQAAGLNVPSATKRGMFTVHDSLVLKSLGTLSLGDQQSLEISLRLWLGLK
jgi:mRNA interferase MazF